MIQCVNTKKFGKNRGQAILSLSGITKKGTFRSFKKDHFTEYIPFFVIPGLYSFPLLFPTSVTRTEEEVRK